MYSSKNIIKKEHCLLPKCSSSFQLSNSLSFHLDMETFSSMNPLFQSPALPCASESTDNAPHDSYFLRLNDTYDLLLYTNTIGFNWHLATGCNGLIPFFCLAHNILMIQIINATKINNDQLPRQDTLQLSWILRRKEASPCRWHWWFFTNTVYQQHTRLAGFPETLNSR